MAESELFPCEHRGAELGTWDCGCSGLAKIYACGHPENAEGQALRDKPIRQCGKPKWGGWACSSCLIAAGEPISLTQIQNGRTIAPTTAPSDPMQAKRQAMLKRAPTLSQAAIKRAQGIGPGADMTRASKLRWISTEQRIADTRKLLALLPRDTAAIIGVARSGLAPAVEIAMALHLPLWILDQSAETIVSAGHGWRLDKSRGMPGPWVAIDDSCATGRSMALGRRLIATHEATRGRKVLWATVYTHPANPKQPDIFAVPCANHHLFEWNFPNSVYSGRTGWDIDGAILTEPPDLPGLAKLLPRRSTIPLICTGRPEREREATEKQLASFGLVWSRLAMLPDNADVNLPMVYSRHKAIHYTASGLDWFVESCPIQAAEIAKLSGKVVICPTNGEVY